jgi:hypothetical protein
VSRVLALLKALSARYPSLSVQVALQQCSTGKTDPKIHQLMSVLWVSADALIGKVGIALADIITTACQKFSRDKGTSHRSLFPQIER